MIIMYYVARMQNHVRLYMFFYFTQIIRLPDKRHLKMQNITPF